MKAVPIKWVVLGLVALVLLLVPLEAQAGPYLDSLDSWLLESGFLCGKQLPDGTLCLEVAGPGHHHSVYLYEDGNGDLNLRSASGSGDQKYLAEAAGGFGVDMSAAEGVTTWSAGTPTTGDLDPDLLSGDTTDDDLIDAVIGGTGISITGADTGWLKVTAGVCSVASLEASLTDADIPNDITVNSSSTVTAPAFETTLASGETGEVNLLEDPDNGTHAWGFKAPASLTADTQMIVPDGDGSAGDCLVTNGSATFSWGSPDFATSDTPSLSREGQNVWDTDNDELLVHDGAEAVIIAQRSVPYSATVFAPATTVTTGDGKVMVVMPFKCRLVGVHGQLATASSSGAVNVDLRDEAGNDVLSTNLTIDESELGSDTAAAAAAIAAAYDDLDQYEVLWIDVDGAGTGAAGLNVTLYVVRVQ